jgi:hypothetical protein
VRSVSYFQVGSDICWVPILVGILVAFYSSNSIVSKIFPSWNSSIPRRLLVGKCGRKTGDPVESLWCHSL